VFGDPRRERSKRLVSVCVPPWDSSRLLVTCRVVHTFPMQGAGTHDGQKIDVRGVRAGLGLLRLLKYRFPSDRRGGAKTRT